MMEVILRDDIKSLGKAGDLVRVKPGYARNFLLPQGLAYEATEGNKKRIVAETKARNVRLAAEKDAALAAAAGLAAVELTFTRKAGEEGKLFGSITSQDIADSLAARGKLPAELQEMRERLLALEARVVVPASGSSSTASAGQGAG